MKVLVTGAAGFIGSHVVEACVREGHHVRALVRYNSAGRSGWLDGSDVLPRIDVVAGDVRDHDSVARAMQGCDAVLHLAALIGIPYSYLSPLAYVRTNVEGTYNVLEAARNQQLGKVLVTSTSETYGSAQYVPIDERHPLVGQSPYSASKIAADQLAISYHRSFGLPVRIARPFNTFGPRQSARAVIPTVIAQILAGQREVRLGNLAPLRDLTYVEDTVAGLLALLRSDAAIGEVTNIGSNAQISVGDLGRVIAELMGAEVELVEEAQRVRPDASEVMHLRCDNSRMRELTGWAPRVGLRLGLTRTIEWLRAHQRLYRPELYNV